MISLDTECTGLDLRHGAKPYLVTTCNEKGLNTYWEWDVNPVNREPIVEYNDLTEIQGVIDNADKIVLQSAKFDVAALQQVFLGRLKWDWGKVYCTLLAGHLLASNQPHDLTTMVAVYLGINVQPYEDAVQKATVEARRIAAREYKDWRIASKDLPEMPSAKGKIWKYDMWLPRVIAKEQKRPKSDSWWTVCAEYGNSDPTVTLALFKKQRELLKERGLWKIYLERLKVLPVIYKMEDYGVTMNGQRTEEQAADYQRVAERCKRVCIRLADGEIDELPVNGVSNALKKVVFKKFGLVSNKKTEGGAPSMDKDVLAHWLVTTSPRSKAHVFIKNLMDYRKHATALGYLKTYQRYWMPVYKHPHRGGQVGLRLLPWFRLLPSLNPTGTATLRCSSSNPNEQNISKKEGFNLRYCFGPAPGREWWSLDAENIELRLPAYEAGETEMIDLFEKPNEPPYFGKVHSLMFSIVYSKEFELGRRNIKEKYPALYRRVKNGDFAVQYGSVEQSGTADRAYGVPGAFAKVKRRFKEIHGPGGLNERMIAYAEKHGYVETIPDKTVDPTRGYPLLCSRSNWGRISPTIPLNYHVQGTACWWMMKAMIRCQAYLDELNARPESQGYYMIMQVHDELVFDFPKGKKVGSFRHVGNLAKIRKIAKLMEQGGDDLGIPTPVSIEYHANNWSEGVSI